MSRLTTVNFTKLNRLSDLPGQARYRFEKYYFFVSEHNKKNILIYPKRACSRVRLDVHDRRICIWLKYSVGGGGELTTIPFGIR